MPVLLGTVLGIALQLQQPRLWSLGHYLWIVGAGLGLLAVRWRCWRLAALALIAAALLGFGLTGLRAAQFAEQALAAQLEGRDIRITGMVSAMPQRNEAGIRFRFKVDSAEMDGQALHLLRHVYLGWWGASGAQDAAPNVRPGERWSFSVRLRAPHGNSNPHGFDYELWLWEQGIQATGYVRAGPRDLPPQRLQDTWQHPVEQARHAVRARILAYVENAKSAGLLAALVVGDQNAIDKTDWDIFRATGVAHLMSISGLHVTMFAWAAAALVGWLWRRSARLCMACPTQHAALIGGIALAAGYALFSGWGVPSQRTIWMLATVGLLRLWGRRWPWPPVWLLACAVVSCIDPWALLQAGFWLSFVAVGVLFATDPGGGTHAAEADDGVGARVPRFIKAARAMMHEQWVVTVALTPLSLLLFGQVSVIGLVANAIAIPWVTLVVTPLAMAGVLLSPLWSVASWALQALGMCLQWLAALPWSSVSVPAAPLWAGVLGVIGGLLVALRLPWHARLLGLPLLLPVLFWQVQRPAPGEFELIAADIGQGNAVIVRTARHTVLYDSGPRYGTDSDAGSRVLVPLLRALDERLDMLMLSHRDIDHTGGAAAVLAMQPTAALTGSLEDAHELRAMGTSTRCQAGQSWSWDGVRFEVLHPQAADYDQKARSNAMSCVLRISTATRSALLAGDIEQPQEARLLAQGVPLAADVLLVPHHGSKTSSSEAFLRAVHPTIALVQAGYRNRFGHPAAPVVERYRMLGVRMIDTPRCGAATWNSARPEQVDCHRQSARRYWRHRADAADITDAGDQKELP